MRPLPVFTFFVIVMLGGSSFAAEAPASQPAAAPAETKPETPAAKESEKAAEKPADEAAAETKAGGEKSAADQKPSPQRFVPSEQVRADFDVSFPIDI